MQHGVEMNLPVGVSAIHVYDLKQRESNVKICMHGIMQEKSYFCRIGNSNLIQQKSTQTSVWMAHHITEPRVVHTICIDSVVC